MPFPRTQILYSLASAETRRYLAFTGLAYFEVQVGESGVAGIAAQAYYLSLVNGIAFIHQHSVVLKVPVMRLRAVFVFNDDVVSFRKHFGLETAYL